MFERFTDGARRVVVLALAEARGLGHPHVGTEHVLLGLVRAPDTAGGAALAALGVEEDAARAQVVAIVGRGAATPAGDLPLTKGTKKLLELALREALRLGDTHIGTEHLVLGLVRDTDSTGARVLRELAVEPKAAREKVLELRATAPREHTARARVEVVESPALSPRTQEMLQRGARQALRLGVAYAGGRFLPLRLLGGADSLTRGLQGLGVDLGAPGAAPLGAVAPNPLGLTPATCSFCATPSPECGALFSGAHGALICEACVARAAAGFQPPARPPDEGEGGAPG